MGVEEKIIQAKEYYESGSITQALKICVELVAEDANDSEVYILALKVFFRAHEWFTATGDEGDIEGLNESIHLSILPAVRYSDDAEKTISDIGAAFNEWVEQLYRKNLEEFEKAPCLKSYRSLQKAELSVLKVKLSILKGMQDVFSAGLSRCQPELISSSDISTIKFDSFKKVFEKSKRDFERYNRFSAEEYKRVADNIYNSWTAIERAIESTAEDDDIPVETRVERLNEAAEVVRLKLESIAFIDGKALSLCFVEKLRHDDIVKLKELYTKIRRLDPQFSVPALPNESGIPISNVISASTGSSSCSSGGCYVATAVYGSYDCPQVWTLRRYRDNTLASTWYGRAFVHIYYAVSPTLVKWFGETQWFSDMWKPKLDRMVEWLNEEGVVDTPYQDRRW